jgi:hypothetical protein
VWRYKKLLDEVLIRTGVGKTEIFNRTIFYTMVLYLIERTNWKAITWGREVNFNYEYTECE